jgi:hypothetical protein
MSMNRGPGGVARPAWTPHSGATGRHPWRTARRFGHYLYKDAPGHADPRVVSDATADILPPLAERIVQNTVGRIDADDEPAGTRHVGSSGLRQDDGPRPGRRCADRWPAGPRHRHRPGMPPALGASSRWPRGCAGRAGSGGGEPAGQNSHLSRRPAAGRLRPRRQRADHPAQPRRRPGGAPLIPPLRRCPPDLTHGVLHPRSQRRFIEHQIRRA